MVFVLQFWIAFLLIINTNGTNSFVDFNDDHIPSLTCMLLFMLSISYICFLLKFMLLNIFMYVHNMYLEEQLSFFVSTKYIIDMEF